MGFRNWLRAGGLVSRALHTSCVRGLVLACALAPLPARGGRNPSIVEKVVKVWAERENRVQSVDCEYSAEITYGAKSCTYYYEIPGKPPAIPPEDLVVKNEFRVRFTRGDKMRLDRRGLQPIEETRDFQQRAHAAASDGNEYRDLWGKDESPGEPRYAPVGTIHKEAHPWVARLDSFRALFLLYRSSCPEVASWRQLDQFSLKGKTVIAGRECVLFERGGGLQKSELAIDMSRDYAPVRLRILHRDGKIAAGAWSTSWSLDINYKDLAGGAWRLAGWKSVVFKNDGSVRQQTDATITNCSLNVTIPDTVFQLEFPVGTLVQDRKAGETYIRREDGTKRRVTQAERDAFIPYKQLLVTEPPDDELSSGSDNRLLLLLVLAGVLGGVLAVAWLAYKLSHTNRGSTIESI